MTGPTLTAVVLAAIFAFPLPLTAPRDAAEAAPEGCEQSVEAWLCEWSFEATTRFGGLNQVFDVPVFPRTLVTFTILLEGTNNGWNYAFFESVTDPRREDARWTYLSGGFETGETSPAENATRTRYRQETSHWFETKPGTFHVLEFFTSQDVSPTSAVASRSSEGTFRLTYIAEPLPAGEVPARPAATREDPHVRDGIGDAARPEVDLVAVWLDDARVEDGIFDVHLAVRDYSAIDFDGVAFLIWYAFFPVNGVDYFVRWYAYPNATDSSLPPTFYCGLGELRADGFVHHISTPRCEHDVANGTMRADLPERAIGSPGPGQRFDTIRGWVLTVPSGNVATRFDPAHPRALVASDGNVADDSTGQRYAFALGGPDVWDDLNPRLAVVEAPPPPWWRAPLARENIPDTLQVLGVPSAIGTFLVGLWLLRRRRLRVQAHLDEIDRIVTAHESDAHRGLLALGDLEIRVDRLYRAGTIHESEYQIVSQRIATAATRLSLARERAGTARAQ